MHTPGHSPDHVVFWHAESGTVFTGDLLVQGSTVVIPASHGGSLTAYLAVTGARGGACSRRARCRRMARPSTIRSALIASLPRAIAASAKQQVLEALAAGECDGRGHRRAHLPRPRSGAHAAGARQRAGPPLKLADDGVAARDGEAWRLR